MDKIQFIFVYYPSQRISSPEEWLEA